MVIIRRTVVPSSERRMDKEELKISHYSYLSILD